MAKGEASISSDMWEELQENVNKHISVLMNVMRKSAEFAQSRDTDFALSSIPLDPQKEQLFAESVLRHIKNMIVQK